MCTALSFDLYCTIFKCPHNLFWEELNLEREKIQMTDKALEIRNCCCLIMNPWTSEEISNAWGLTREEIRRSEQEALKKLKRKARINLEENNDIDHRKCPSYRNFKFEEIRKLTYGIYSLQNSCGR
jgi:GTPase SAR1 family protein